MNARFKARQYCNAHFKFEISNLRFGNRRTCPTFQILSYYGRGAVKVPAPTADRDRPGSRRSEPSSRTTLIGEQPNPWDRLQPQDVMSRHRGAKPHRRYGRSDAISLLSPAYLLSVELWPFHTGPQDH